MRTLMVLAAGLVLLLTGPAAAVPMSVSFSADAIYPGKDGVSYASGFGTVVFDPDTFLLPDGVGDGSGWGNGPQGLATSGTITLVGLSAYDLPIDKTTFMLPPTPIWVVLDQSQCSCSAFDLTLFSGIRRDPPGVPQSAPVIDGNPDGFSLDLDGYRRFELINGLPDHPVYPATYVYFEITVPEPGSLLLLAAGLFWLAAGAWSRRQVIGAPLPRSPH